MLNDMYADSCVSHKMLPGSQEGRQAGSMLPEPPAPTLPNRPRNANSGRAQPHLCFGFPDSNISKATTTF